MVKAWGGNFAAVSGKTQVVLGLEPTVNTSLYFNQDSVCEAVWKRGTATGG